MKYLIIMVLFFSFSANAGWEMKPKDKMTQEQRQMQNQTAEGGDATASADASADATATNANSQTVNDYSSVALSTSFRGGDTDTELSVNSNYEASAPSIVLVPNNNTSECIRVYGLSFSNLSGGGGLGLPYRDKACDFEMAGAAADARGDAKIAWYWRCHKKNLYNTFDGRNKKGKTKACYDKMVGMLTSSEGTPAPPYEAALVTPQIEVTCTTQDHPEAHGRLLEACVSK